MEIIALSASLRNDSLNKKLLTIASKFAEKKGAKIVTVDLKDFPLPAYDGNIEETSGVHENAIKLNKVLSSRIMMIASPEYNFSMPGHFKNTFDWLSRIRPSPFPGKIVCLMSASPSLIGGNRGLWSLRMPFEACGSVVHPDMFSLSSAHEAFDEQGNLKDSKQTEKLQKNISAFVDFARALVE